VLVLDAECQVEPIELMPADQLDLVSCKDKELAEANYQIEQLEAQIAQMTCDSDQLKGENNSLKKKVHSLQIDFEKLTQKVSTTQARSSGGTHSDANSMQTANAMINGPAADEDLHN